MNNSRFVTIILSLWSIKDALLGSPNLSAFMGFLAAIAFLIANIQAWTSEND